MIDYDDYDEPPEEQPRDPATDVAVARLRKFFAESPARLFYSTQIVTALEREHFHWITGRALLELANNKEIQRSSVTIVGSPVNFYAHPKHRYWQRERNELVELLTQIFNPDFAQAIGRHGELMFDAALGRAGFRAKGQNVNAFNGKIWQESNHNLDRIYVRDGVAYGAEIKNTQNYIEKEELEIKIRLCKHLGVIPLFIMRFAPKSYMFQIIQSGGFGLLFEEQMYPLGHTQLLRVARQTLGLKIGSPKDVKEGDIQRFVKWHEKKRPAST